MMIDIDTAGAEAAENIGDLMRELAEARIRKEETAEAAKAASADYERAEAAVGRALAASGLEKMTAAGLTVCVLSKPRVRYEPDRFDDIQARLIADGRGYVFARQFVASRLDEAVRTGYALPDGLSIEMYPDLSVRKA